MIIRKSRTTVTLSGLRVTCRKLLTLDDNIVNVINSMTTNPVKVPSSLIKVPAENTCPRLSNGPTWSNPGVRLSVVNN